MLIKDEIREKIFEVAESTGIKLTEELKAKITITYPQSQFGDYATNAALILAKEARLKPFDLALELSSKLGAPEFEKVEAVAPGFINFTFKNGCLTEKLKEKPDAVSHSGKILVE